MAQRRMFSSRVTSSGRFLNMPPSAQALYFHLGLNADDDGVVEAATVMKITDSKPDDFSVLLAKNFIYKLNDDLVVVIIDWREHNLIRADRKVDSIYKALLEEKLPQLKLIEPKPRADTGVPTAGRPLDNQWTAQVRLGKDNTKGADAPIEVVPDKPLKDMAYKEVFTVFSSTKQGWMFHKAQIDAAKRLAIKPGVEKVRRTMEFYREIKDDPMCPEIFTPYDLEAKATKLAAFKRKNGL